MSTFSNRTKIGIVGGGQLGRMLVQAGSDWDLRFASLDPDPQAPCYQMTEFTNGALTHYDTVLKFGQSCDVITIEIENINTQALAELQRQGKRVYPQPEIIELIQDKRTQKQFYKEKGIPTADFILVNNRADVVRQKNFLPAVNKLGKEGYDGRGVEILRSEKDLEKAFDAPGLLERLIDFDKEIAVIAARNTQGEIALYPPVEMVFHPEANLVEYLFSPAQISDALQQEAQRIARLVIEELNMVGILAVEMFVTREGTVLVNEIAPRPHNSGHQTIEANTTSQYEQHLRAILGLPLGDTSIVIPSAMVNLLGEAGFEGDAVYEGWQSAMALSGVHIHLYGKKKTKPFRKMGHVTITDTDVESLKKKANFVKTHLRVKA